MTRTFTHEAVPFILLVLCAAGCPTERNGFGDLLTAGNDSISKGEVLARVGKQHLHSGEVPLYAEMALELRRQAGLDVQRSKNPDELLDLAVEFLALHSAAQEISPSNPAAMREEEKSLLARVYLRRLAAASMDQPVSDAEIENAYKQEVLNYMTTGESEIYRPTRVDAVAIAIGYFPDLHVPDEGEEPILQPDEALRLGQEIKLGCSDLANDLDEFLLLGRHFMESNPTVSVEEFWRIIAQPELANIDRRIHKVITGLPENGEISEPVETPRGVFIIRRGVKYPGMGEEIKEVKDALAEKVRDRRLKQRVEERLQDLAEEYAARKWSERLTSTISEKHKPQVIR